MTDRDIEDTREPEFEGVDDDEMWKRIDDALSDDLRDFVHEEIHDLETQNFNLRRANKVANIEISALTRLLGATSK